MEGRRFEAEFGHYAAWVVDAIQEMGLRDPIPAACRGTGNPSLLERLAAGLSIKEGSLVLDIGVGVGGPAAWLVRERSCRVVGIDIMIQAVQGASRLFRDIDVAVASSATLPFSEGTFDAAWALGVIEMLPDKEHVFQEIARVLIPGARVVLYDFVAAESHMQNLPAADHFESPDDINRKLEEAGLDVLRTEAVPLMSPSPDGWQAAIKGVRQRVRVEHGGDQRLSMAEEERSKFNRLRRRGSIQEWEFIAEKPGR